jgi:glyoxylase-like metal-dependent hydrolase (beta-lactamase superfamily II)
MAGFTEVADRVFVLRYPVLDVNVTLVLGDGAALVVDTLSGAGQARELIGLVRRIAAVPLSVVNTHHHFDHCFGNAELRRAGAGPFWGHQETVRELTERGEQWRRAWVEQWQASQPELAATLAREPILAPTRTVHHAATLDVGGRRVELRHLGRGHTAGDLVALVPDARLVVAGDLVEEGTPPDFADGYPLDWPDALAALATLLSPDAVVVPGHGAPVDRAFVQAQHAQLSRLDWLIRDGHAAEAPADEVARQAPFDREVSLVAVGRGYAELSSGLA